MPSHTRIYVETVLDPETLDTGSWSRKAAVARVETEGSGSWSRRMTSDPDASTGPWQRRMVDGLWTGPSRSWEAQLWQGLPDFSGLTVGSVAGLLGDTGQLPTGWSYAADGITITVDEATHDVAGVECITITAEIVEAGEAQIYFPGLQATAEGEQWIAYVYVADMVSDVEELEFGIAEFVDLVPTDFNGEVMTEGLNQYDKAMSPTINNVQGAITIASGIPSTITVTFAAKLEEVP